MEVDGIPHWFDPTQVRRRSSAARAAYLFPAYDEAVLTYPQVNFPAPSHHPYAEHPDPFWASVVLDGSNVGLWKRTVRPDVVQVEVRLAPTVSSDGRDQVRVAAQRLSDFLQRDLSLIENEGTPHLWGGDLGHPSRRPRRAHR